MKTFRRLVPPTRSANTFCQHVPSSNTDLLPTRTFFQHGPSANTYPLPTRTSRHHAPFANTHLLPTRIGHARVVNVVIVSKVIKMEQSSTGLPFTVMNKNNFEEMYAIAVFQRANRALQ